MGYRMSIDPNDERESWINKSVNIGVHLTVHLMHPNYCHVTTVVVLLLPYISNNDYSMQRGDSILSL